MNRYPLWVYVTIAVALVLGALYTLPNFFGEAPAGAPWANAGEINTIVSSTVSASGGVYHRGPAVYPPDFRRASRNAAM